MLRAVAGHGQLDRAWADDTTPCGRVLRPHAVEVACTVECDRREQLTGLVATGRSRLRLVPVGVDPVAVARVDGRRVGAAVGNRRSCLVALLATAPRHEHGIAVGARVHGVDAVLEPAATDVVDDNVAGDALVLRDDGGWKEARRLGDLALVAVVNAVDRLVHDELVVATVLRDVVVVEVEAAVTGVHADRGLAAVGVDHTYSHLRIWISRIGILLMIDRRMIGNVVRDRIFGNLSLIHLQVCNTLSIR